MKVLKVLIPLFPASVAAMQRRRWPCNTCRMACTGSHFPTFSKFLPFNNPNTVSRIYKTGRSYFIPIFVTVSITIFSPIFPQIWHWQLPVWGSLWGGSQKVFPLPEKLISWQNWFQICVLFVIGNFRCVCTPYFHWSTVNLSYILEHRPFCKVSDRVLKIQKGNIS